MAIFIILQTSSYFAVSMLFGLVGLNAPQKYRPAFTTGIVLTSTLAYRNVTDANFGFTGTDTIAMFVLFYISHMTCALCIDQYVLPNATGTSMEWRAAYKMLFNARWIGTGKDVQTSARAQKDLELPFQFDEFYSAYPTSDLKSFIRSPRFRFLRNRLISFITIYAVNQLYESLFNNVLPQHVESIGVYDLLPSKQTYFRRLSTVTLRETIIRTWIVCYWAWYSYSLYTSLHDILAFIFVGIGLDNPEDWPPLYGNILEATTVRGFWGKFWHRLVYRSYTSYGKLVSLNILKLPRNSMVGKFFISGFVFVLSGLVHAVTLRQLGFQCGAMSEVTFYASHYLAILAETAVQTSFKRLARGYKINSAISKTIGYLWVFGFLFYSVPKSQFPKVFCLPE